MGKNTKKTSRAKKSCTSKASRLSTQSTITVTSEAPTVDDDGIDQSILSQATVKSSKSTKKATKSKTRKTKKDETVEVSSQMDVDSLDDKPVEISKPKRATRGKKRTSEEISQDLRNGVDDERFHSPEPPAKRRATQVRNSIAQQPADALIEQIASEQNPPEETISAVAPKKGRKGAKKSTSSKNRKTSTASTATKASLRSRVPEDSELEAAVEADLDRDVHDVKVDPIDFNEEPADRRTSKPAKQSTTASIAPMRASHQVDEGTHSDQLDGYYSDKGHDAEAPPTKAKPQKAVKRRTTTKKSKKEAPSSQDKPEVPVAASSDAGEDKPETSENFQPRDSLVSVEIQVRKLDTESDFETTNKPASKKAGRKPGNKGKKTEKASKAEVEHTLSENQEELAAPEKTQSDSRLTERESMVVDVNDQTEDKQEGRHSRASRSSKVPPKTAERYSDILQERHRTQSLLESLNHASDSQKQADTAANASSDPVQQSTPSPSPQSSDAENRPPSARPSASRPPVLSPPKTQTTRVPLATSTPLSPSKRQPNTGYLTSSNPWTPVDIEEILLSASEGKENRDLRSTLSSMKEALASPEKKMTVEEWILWNAKNGEERLKRECERLVGMFEREGGRAMRVLEGIECID
jgi:hypothetical protein